MIRFLNILLLLLCISCFQKINENVLGEWNIIHIYVDGKDILGNDKPKEFYRYRSMYIENKIDQLTIELDSDKDFYADLEVYEDTVILSRSTMSDFDGKYSILIKDSIFTGTNRVRKFVILESETVKIVGNR